MKLAVATVLAGLIAAPFAIGQKLELKLDDIAARASSKSEVNLDGAMLKAQSAKFPGVQSIRVRNYEFEKPGAYSDAELDPIRKQVGEGSGWSRMVRVEEKNESIDVFMLIHGEEVGGFLLLVTEPKELTVVNIVGALKLAQLKELVNSSVQYDLGALKAQTGKSQP